MSMHTGTERTNDKAKGGYVLGSDSEIRDESVVSRLGQNYSDLSNSIYLRQ